jgi:hypothetical protein
MPRRNWLITDVSSGFGRIMTEQLLARGDRIGLVDYDPSCSPGLPSSRREHTAEADIVP